MSGYKDHQTGGQGGDLMPIVFLTNYLSPYQAALFSRATDVIITYSPLDAYRQWGPLKTEARVKDISRLNLRKRLSEISETFGGPLHGTLIGGSSRSPEFWFAIALCRLRRAQFAIWLERPSKPITRLRGRALRFALGKTGTILAVGVVATIIYRQFIRGVKVVNFPYSYGEGLSNDRKLVPKQFLGSCRNVTALIIGTEWKRKGLDILLNAAAAMPEELQGRLKLRVVGLKALPSELESVVGVCPSVEISYLGYLEPHAVQKELGSADVLVVASRHDGWAVVVEEAMAEGTPVIASDEVGASADLVLDGYSGFTFPSEDSAALAAALSAIMCHEPSDHVLSDGARAVIARHRHKFNIESLERAIPGGDSRTELPGVQWPVVP